MPKIALVHPRESVVASSLPALGLSALGVVFGDIGTSPLYTLKTVLNLTGANPDPTAALGALSLVIWTLIIVTYARQLALQQHLHVLPRYPRPPPHCCYAWNALVDQPWKITSIGLRSWAHGS